MAAKDGFGESLLKFWMAKALEGESQIDEHVEWNAHTKGWLPVSQALSMIFGMLLMATGIWLVFVVAAGQAAAEHETWALLALAVGLALGVPGGILVYRQGRDLIDPYGKTSPVERMLMPYLAKLFDVEEEEEEGETPGRMVPVRSGARTEAVRAAPWTLDVHPHDAELLEFMGLAKVKGLGQASWLENGRVVLRSTGVEVTRGVWDRIMEDLVRWGFVDRGGGGRAASWLVEPERARGILRREVERVREEHSPAPEGARE